MPAGAAAPRAAAGLVLLAAARLDPARGHIDVELRPCKSTDPDQLWVVPAEGTSGNIMHAASKQCLLAKDCKDDPLTALVLDKCQASCLPSHRMAATFSPSQEAHSDTPKAIVSAMMKKLVIDASSERFSGDPPLVLEPWDEKFFTNQQWTATAGPGGATAGQTLRVGKSADSGGGYQPHCPQEPCCLAIHRDIVPDGDGGWSLIALLLVVVALYLGGGVAFGRWRWARRQQHGSGGTSVAPAPLAALHPHYGRLLELGGLVADGLQFTQSKVTGTEQIQQTSANASSSGSKSAHVAGNLPQGGGSKVKKDKRTKKDKKEKKKDKGYEDRSTPLIASRSDPPALETKSVVDGGVPKTTPSGGGGRWVHVSS
eukprot:SAG31_NODE_894_length_11172_cov_25.790572_6_plen_371_part_00